MNNLKNLGDYGEVVNDLALNGGKKNDLYKKIGDIAVAKETPIIMVKGAMYLAGIEVVGFFCFKMYKRIKNRRELIKQEDSLKKEFFNEVDNLVIQSNTDLEINKKEEKNKMEKWKVHMVNTNTGEVEDDSVDEMIFNSQEEAENYACEMRSCQSAGAEILKLSNPYDYSEDYGDGEKYSYEATEIN